jgi:hypothetical protein
MTYHEYRAALKSLSLTQGEAADLLGMSIRTSHGYATGAAIPEIVSRMLWIFQHYPKVINDMRLKTIADAICSKS